VRESLGDAFELGAVRPVRVGVEDAFVSMVRADTTPAPERKRSSQGPAAETSA
jgi:hypothetical protein